ncbi:MAG: TIGR02285 family protein [Desulfonatronovibrionaceae bacterium]
MHILALNCLRSIFYSLLVLFLAAVGPGYAQEKKNEVITWLEPDFPPCFIHSGPYEGMGYEDVITQILEQELQGYEYESEIANVSRIYKEFKQGRQVCHVAFYRTPERREFMYFSIPNTITFPVVLVALRENADLPKAGEMVSLKDVLTRNDLDAALVSERSYGTTLDVILSEQGRDSDIHWYFGQDIGEKTLQMVLGGRVDYTLALPEEVMYWAEHKGVRDRLKVVHLKENQGDYCSWLGYVACPKTKWGAKVISDINRVLREVRPLKRYRKAYERWIDEYSLPRYRRLYKEFFLQTGRGGPGDPCAP